MDELIPSCRKTFLMTIKKGQQILKYEDALELFAKFNIATFLIRFFFLGCVQCKNCMHKLEYTFIYSSRSSCSQKIVYCAPNISLAERNSTSIELWALKMTRNGETKIYVRHLKTLKDKKIRKVLTCLFINVFLLASNDNPSPRHIFITFSASKYSCM